MVVSLALEARGLADLIGCMRTRSDFAQNSFLNLLWTFVDHLEGSCPETANDFWNSNMQLLIRRFWHCYAIIACRLTCSTKSLRHEVEGLQLSFLSASTTAVVSWSSHFNDFQTCSISRQAFLLELDRSSLYLVVVGEAIANQNCLLVMASNFHQYFPSEILDTPRRLLRQVRVAWDAPAMWTWKAFQLTQEQTEQGENQI